MEDQTVRLKPKKLFLEITNYNYLICRFLSIVNKHAPLKAKVIRGGNAPFIDKKLKKEIF